jgi:hypothetical protein
VNSFAFGRAANATLIEKIEIETPRCRMGTTMTTLLAFVLDEFCEIAAFLLGGGGVS